MEVGRIGAGRRVSEFWRSQEAILKVVVGESFTWERGGGGGVVI